MPCFTRVSPQPDFTHPSSNEVLIAIKRADLQAALLRPWEPWTMQQLEDEVESQSCEAWMVRRPFLSYLKADIPLGQASSRLEIKGLEIC